MIIVAAGFLKFKTLEVCSGRESAAGFPGSCGHRAKVIVVAVMVYGSRKIIMGYAGSCSSRSEGLCRFFKMKALRFGVAFIFLKNWPSKLGSEHFSPERFFLAITASFGRFIQGLVDGINEVIYINAMSPCSLLNTFKARRRATQATHALFHKNRNRLGIFAYYFRNTHFLGNLSQENHLLF